MPLSTLFLCWDPVHFSPRHGLMYPEALPRMYVNCCNGLLCMSTPGLLVYTGGQATEGTEYGDEGPS